MRHQISVSLLCLVAVLQACTSEPSAPQSDGETTVTPAELVLTNGRVYTLDEAMPWAEAVAVTETRISFVGSSADAATRVGPETRVIDLAGKLLLPGFIDTHAHPVAGGAYADALSLDTFGQVDEWVAAIADFAAERPQAPVLFGYGFLATTFGPDGPTRDLIDAVVSDRPVLIMDEGFHAAWANSAALAALGIDRDTPDPEPGYSYYRRDGQGDPTGYLLEDTASAAMDQLDVVTPEVITAGTAQVIDLMNQFGVTSVFDAGALEAMDQVAQVLASLAAAGQLTVRIVGSSRPQTADQAATAVAVADQWRQNVKGQRYAYNTLKIPYDGTVESRTAAMFDDYQGEPGNSGQTVFSTQQLADMVASAAAIEMDVHVHALGERAVRDTLDAIASARQQQPGSRSRYTICHVQVIADEDIARFAQLDVIAQSTPLWASYDRYGEPFVSTDQFQRFWRFKSLVDAGARLTFGSDFPASGAGTDGLSPVRQIEIGHTRQFAGEADAPVQPRQSERLSVEELVRGFTLDAAWQLHLEDEIGSIEVGKKADLVVLGEDIFAIDTYSIHKTPVVLTLMDGDVVYEAP